MNRGQLLILVTQYKTGNAKYKYETAKGSCFPTNIQGERKKSRAPLLKYKRRFNVVIYPVNVTNSASNSTLFSTLPSHSSSFLQTTSPPSI